MSHINHKKYINNFFDGFCELDSKGNLISYNKKFSTNLGYDKNELINTSFFNLVDEKIKDKIIDFFKKREIDQDNRKIILAQLKKKNNEKNLFKINLSLVINNEGQKTILIGFLKKKKTLQEESNLNFKDRENFELLLKNKTEELTKSLLKQKKLKNKLEKERFERTQVLSSISHELRTPLNAIIGFSDLMLDTYEDKIINDIREYIEDIKESAKYLLKLVNNVLNISKIDSDKIKISPEPIYLLDFIKNVQLTMESDINKKGLSFEILGIDENKKVNFDAKMFNEVLSNLISNAIKFTNRGKISVKYEETQDNWALLISDTGIGIKEENIENIFIEFSKINNAMIAVSEGHGLGLSLTKKIVKLHDGEISVQSKLNQGTTFKIKFPNLDYKQS